MGIVRPDEPGTCHSLSPSIFYDSHDKGHIMKNPAKSPPDSIEPKKLKITGMVKAYEKRCDHNKHLIEIPIAFNGNWEEFKRRIHLFGQKTAEYFASEDRAIYYPKTGQLGWRGIAADFKFCYEEFKKEIMINSYDTSEWEVLDEYFRVNGINEVYENIGQDPDLRLIYNIPKHLIFDGGLLSGNELKVLLGFKASAKTINDGVKICGWSGRELGKRMGMDKDTVRKCVKTLESKGFLKLMPSLSKTDGQRKKHVYQVKNC